MTNIVGGTDIVGGLPVPSNRTTEVSVAALISVPDGFNLLPFIEVANSLIDEIVAEGCGASYSDAKLELLERWLSAHFVAVALPRASSRSVNGASVSYSLGSLGKGLDSTAYGVQAMAMDTNGCLRSFGMRPMSILYVGEVT